MSTKIPEAYRLPVDQLTEFILKSRRHVFEKTAEYIISVSWEEEKGMKTDKGYWDNLVQRANFLRQLLNDKPDEYKLKARLDYGSILNGYREGDLSFGEAIVLLKAMENSIDQ